MRFLWLLCMLLAWSHGVAARKSIPPEHVISNVESCIVNAEQCFAITRQLQQNSVKSTREWYRATYLLMNAWWELERLSLPVDTFAEYAAMSDSPAVFRATAFTVYAKLLLNKGDKAKGTLYADKATSLILEMPQSALTPRRMSEVIILNQYLGNYERAQVLSDNALERFADIKNSYVKAELLTAAAHNAYHFKRYDDAIELYLKAAEANLKMGSILNAAVCHTNSGRAYQLSENWENAEKEFRRSLGLYKELGHKEPVRDVFYVRLRLAEVLISLGSVDEARELAASVSKEDLHEYHHRVYDTLADKLSTSPDK